MTHSFQLELGLSLPKVNKPKSFKLLSEATKWYFRDKSPFVAFMTTYNFVASN